jgi:hypothetical protein
MGKDTLAVLVTIGFSIVGVVGDYFLKRASSEEESLKSIWFYIGFVVYASTAFGWVFVMKHLKLYFTRSRVTHCSTSENCGS